MEFIFVGIGGAFGSVARYTIGKAINKRNHSRFPSGTFSVNIIGAIILGLATGLNMHENLILLVSEGFLGAFTTFSTFMFQGFNLIKQKKLLNAIMYILISLILGITGFYAGFNFSIQFF